jgi:hypothetical protein
MMGRQDRDQRQLFYEFSLDEMIPADHLLRRRGDGGFLSSLKADPLAENVLHQKQRWHRCV